MAKYIPLDALVAEIKRRIKTNKECMLGLRNLDYYQGKVDALNDTLSSINTLEMKEVDLEKEIQMFSMNLAMKENNGDWEKDIAVTAKHFFELGLKAQKGEQDE